MKLHFAIFYANGVPTFSPGLRSLDRYPGRTSPNTIQPQRGCDPCAARSTPPDGTALRFDSFVTHGPRVGLIAFGQPWAEGRKPVGLEDIKDIGTSSVSRSSSIRVAGSCILMTWCLPPSNSREGSRRASFLQIVRSMTAQSPVPYANGVPSSSPGLRGTRYPGSSPRKTSQPQRGCGHAVSSRALEAERTKTLTALDGFLTGLGYLK